MTPGGKAVTCRGDENFRLHEGADRAPAEIRRRDDVEPGQEFDIERIKRGEYLLVRRAPATNESVADWLLDCPDKDKGFFVPIESESTDTL